MNREARPLGTQEGAVAPEPIAIVGIGCRFPKADGPAAFWRLVRDGVDAIDDMPPGRFDVDAFYDPRPGTPGKVVTRQGGFLADIQMFDPHFFGISPREANCVDPQQRLLLEVAWEAFEDAGIPRERLMGSRTGVFIGMWTNEYEDCMYAASPEVDLYVTTGGGRYSASGRLSYVFDLQGPSLTVDTACSSSLVAVHLALRSLWSGESELALAGGVNLILQPQITIGYSRSKMLSPDARCKFGDAGANGYVRSEGVGVVLLKPLARALADRDPIWALIRGSAVNNDGHSSELLVAPSPRGQEAMLREAYRSAGVRPAQVAYMEAHGTGTAVGDPVELEALGRVLSEGRPADRPCLIGSVKTNIGHAEAASGIAGLIKAVLCLKHRLVPPSLHFKKPNPRIPWQQLPFVVQTQLGPLPASEAPALAAVNSFGVTGTNAHVVLQEAPPDVPRAPAQEEEPRPRLLPISAATPEALKSLAHAWRAQLAASEDHPRLGDICFTAGARRTHHDHRLAVVGATASELLEKLDAYLAGEERPGLAPGQCDASRSRKVVFVFPGQGSQWLGMGRRLQACEPAFRDSLDRSDAAIRAEAGFSVLAELAAEASASRLDEIDIVQPTLFSIQVALAGVWRAWGIEPAAVVGHSMGEVAAACVAGVLSLEDAVRVICRRSRLLRRTRGQGAMAVVELSLEDAAGALAGYEDRLSVAVSNSSRSTVVSGDPRALDELIGVLERREVFCRRVKVDVASHSPQMDPLRADLLAALTGIEPKPGEILLCSTVSAAVVDGRELSAEYWTRNLRQPVLFCAAVHRLLADGHETFIEMSPHPILLPAIQQELQQLGRSCNVLASTRREEDELVGMLESLGRLYSLGWPIDWEGLGPADGRCVPLPAYAWQRERFWYEPGAAAGKATRRQAGAHPLLGERLSSSVHEGTHFWESEVAADAPSFLADHRVGGLVVFPAAAYMELALAAASQVLGPDATALEAVSFGEALVLSGAPRVLQVVLSSGAPGVAGFRILSREAQSAERTGGWTLHAYGSVRKRAAEARASTPPSELAERGASSVSSQETYAGFAARRLDYGPSFRGIDRLWHGDFGVLARIRLPESAAGAGDYRIHPALLDALLQLRVAALPETIGAEQHTYVPASLEAIRVHERPGPDAELWGLARPSDPTRRSNDADVGDLLLLAGDGRILVEASGLRLQRLSREEASESFFAIEWRAQPLPEASAEQAGAGSWLVLAGRHEAGTGLASVLAARGVRSLVVGPGMGDGPGQRGLELRDADGFRRLVAELGPELRGVAHLWALDSADPETDGLAALDEARALGPESVLQLVQALAAASLSPRVVLVTAGAHGPGAGRSGAGLAQAPLWGLGPVIASEHPELRCANVDLGAEPSDAAVAALADELLRGPAAARVAFHEGKRFEARLVSRTPKQGARDGARRSEPVAGRSFRAAVSAPGVLDNLVLRCVPREPVPAGHVEVEVEATGLNFLNVMSALGIYPGYSDGVGPLGIECSGRISAVGPGVSDLTIGEEVLAVVHDCLASHVVADVRLVRRVPQGVSLTAAAGLPIVFLTAYYALHTLGRLAAGERILIHAAAGGVGLAALQLAKLAGAEVFATAGSPEKRALLESLGVRHVMDSRSLAFADAVMERTNGEGVDLVLNSLAGEAIPRSLALLRSQGRFLEIGKRDIYDNAQIGLAPFRNSLAYFAIDLDRMIRERPGQVGALLDEVLALVQAGHVTPLPTRLFPVSQAADALRHMALARHVGKLVISIKDPEAHLEAAAGRISGNATYWITGGLGGLGLRVARFLVDKGADSLVLMGRHEASAEARASVDALRARGARVHIARGDVTRAADVADVLSTIDSALPPLKGIVHAAGFLDDGILVRLDPARLAAVMAPKVLGAWNLHALTKERPLDFFVLFSSVASFMGFPGQANYAAGNAFLDALAAYRRGSGAAGLSVNWGPWAEVGLAAVQANRGERLALRGLGSIAPERGIAALERLLAEDAAQVAVMPVNWPLYLDAFPAARQSSFFAVVAGASQSETALPGRDDARIREALLAAEPGRRRRTLFLTYLKQQVARVLRLAPSRVDAQKPLRALGLDSLMALELRNRLEADLKLTLPATVVWNYPTLEALAPHLAGRMQIPLDAEQPEAGGAMESPVAGEVPAAHDDVAVARLLDEIEQLPVDEARRLLAGEP